MVNIRYLAANSTGVLGGDGAWSAGCIYKSELKQIEAQAVADRFEVGVYLNGMESLPDMGRQPAIPRKTA
jgi:hypothetical protein